MGEHLWEIHGQTFKSSVSTVGATPMFGQPYPALANHPDSRGHWVALVRPQGMLQPKILSRASLPWPTHRHSLQRRSTVAVGPTGSTWTHVADWPTWVRVSEGGIRWERRGTAAGWATVSPWQAYRAGVALGEPADVEWPAISLDGEALLVLRSNNLYSQWYRDTNWPLARGGADDAEATVELRDGNGDLLWTCDLPNREVDDGGGDGGDGGPGVG